MQNGNFSMRKTAFAQTVLHHKKQKHMKNKLTQTLILILFFQIQSCQIEKSKQGISDEQIWKMGWRMIENSMNENFNVAELQFDSLLHISDKIDRKFLTTGLEVKSKLNKGEEITELLNNQDEETLRVLCKKGFLSNIKSCNGLSEEKVLNEDLQLKIIDLYVKDQTIRGNIMSDIISKYEIDTTGIKTKYDWSNPDEVNVDELTRNQLKEIFKEYGFPTRELIGQDAMDGVFYIIQHSDGDKEWQKSQLPNIELVVKKGVFSGQKYAYLYDRIKVNSGENQLYGTQFKMVDPSTNRYELVPVKNLPDLNKRRKEMGMMPIELYRKFHNQYVMQSSK